MAFAEAQADVVVSVFELSATNKAWLMAVPCKGSLPTDPLIYR
jgi:cyanate lyase